MNGEYAGAVFGVIYLPTDARGRAVDDYGYRETSVVAYDAEGAIDKLNERLRGKVDPIAGVVQSAARRIGELRVKSVRHIRDVDHF